LFLSIVADATKQYGDLAFPALNRRAKFMPTLRVEAVTVRSSYRRRALPHGRL